MRQIKLGGEKLFPMAQAKTHVWIQGCICVCVCVCVQGSIEGGKLEARLQAH